MRENAAEKAKRYLCEGRVIITSVAGEHIRATCRGDGELHHVEIHGDDRRCTCLARGRCSHIAAVGLVTATNHREDHR